MMDFIDSLWFDIALGLTCYFVGWRYGERWWAKIKKWS